MKITRAQAAEHLAKNGGGYPPAVKAYLDRLWAGEQPAEEAREVVVSKSHRIGYTEMMKRRVSAEMAAPHPDLPKTGNRKQRRAQAAHAQAQARKTAKRDDAIIRHVESVYARLKDLDETLVWSASEEVAAPRLAKGGDVYVRDKGETEFRKANYTVSNLKWTPL